tara:strand:+ start:978 stop:1184 length:207 start_codon:yes stop_codon:yes gene_type:complete
MPIYPNECQHDIYLGSDKIADYYLYLDDAEIVSICKRTGHLGEYETIPSISEKFLKELKSIISLRSKQ